jgi:hypothetical protein
MRRFFAGLCALLLSTQTQAQVIPSVNLYSTYTDNLFFSSSRQADWINLAFVDLDYAFKEDFGLFYSGSAHYFNGNDELFNHLHQVGLSFARPFGDTGSLYAGTELGLRLDQPLYDYRSFRQARAFISAKAYLSPELLAHAGYSVRRQDYTNAADYSYYEQSFYTRLTHFLPTRTTLQIAGELGWKTYVDAVDELSFIDFEVPARFGQDPHLLQWVASAKVAQSIGSDMGLQIEWRRRAQLSGDSRFVGSLFYNPNDDLFDDRYSYSGQQVKSTLKYLAPWGMTWQSTLERETRDYSSRPAYDASGQPLLQTQAEKRYGARIGLQKAFYLEGGWIREIGVDSEWSYRRIDSNDPYYDAGARSYTLGLQIGF